jgi:hypothetical protein
MANHYNAEAIYWGGARLSGIRRALYRTASPLRRNDEFFGHLPTSQYFWGDLCKQHVCYCRNLFTETLISASLPFDAALRSRS